jgi:ankyrin repeat protein
MLFLMLLVPVVASAATNELTGALQRGLFEEEANGNLTAAAEAYQTVSAQFDHNRKLAATAIFRLGEVYRKQSKTNEAAAQYERIVREFADQEPLATLSRQNLAGLGFARPPNAATIGNALSHLENQYLLLKLQLEQAKNSDSSDSTVRLLDDEELTKVWSGFQELWRNYATNRNLKMEVDQKLEEFNQARQKVYQRREQELATLKLQLDETRSSGALPRAWPGQSPAATTTDEEEAEIRRIQAMIQNSPDLINAPREGGYTPLGRAAGAGWLRVAKFLLDNGAAIQQAGNGTTPLHCAVSGGHRAMVEALLARGAKLEARDSTGGTPLHLAAENGFLSVAEALLQRGADLEAENSTANGRQTPLERAAAKGHASLATMLVDKGAKFRGALWQAVMNGHPETLAKLLELGARPDADTTPDTSPLLAAVERNQSEAVKLLLAAKANPNRDLPRKPLVLAAAGKQPAIARQLLVADANPNTPGTLRGPLPPPGNNLSSPVGEITMTPLQVAVGKRDVAMVKLLLEFKADPNTRAHEKSGWGTPLSPLTRWAMAEPEILKALLDAGADANAEISPGEASWTLLAMAAQQYSAETIELLLAHGAKPDGFEDEGETPLRRVAARGCVDCVKALLAAKADPNLAATNGWTPLFNAISSGNREVMELLIAAGADVNRARPGRWTPLHSAVSWHSREMVELLLQKGANPNVLAANGLSPLKQLETPPGQGVMQPGRQRASSDELATLLRRYGARDELPFTDRIEVRRAATKFAQPVFQMETNGWNAFTLREALARHYGFLSTDSAATWRAATSILPSKFWSAAGCQFPELERVVIRRPLASGENWTNVPVNAAALLASDDCERDVPLQPGDLIEIPEADHPVDLKWPGLSLTEVTNLLRCVSRTVTLTIKGTPNRLTLELRYQPDNSFGAYGERTFELQAGSFMLKSVLLQSRLLRASSDLRRVKVKRAAHRGEPPREWQFDCSGVKAPEFWVRDGDVIEVPDRS